MARPLASLAALVRAVSVGTIVEVINNEEALVIRIVREGENATAVATKVVRAKASMMIKNKLV